MWSLSATCSAFVHIPFHAELFVSAKQANTKTEWPDPFAWASQFNSFSNSRQPMPAPILSTARPLMRLETWNIMETLLRAKKSMAWPAIPFIQGPHNKIQQLRSLYNPHLCNFEDLCFTLKMWVIFYILLNHRYFPNIPKQQNWQNRLSNPILLRLQPSPSTKKRSKEISTKAWMIFRMFFQAVFWSVFQTKKKKHKNVEKTKIFKTVFFFFKWALPMFRFRIVGDFLSLIKIQVHTSNKNMNITKLQHNLRHHHELCRPARMSEMWKTVKNGFGRSGIHRGKLFTCVCRLHRKWVKPRFVWLTIGS